MKNKVKTIVSMLALGATLTACQTPAERVAMYKAECAQFGHAYGSAEMARCVQKLNSEREKRVIAYEKENRYKQQTTYVSPSYTSSYISSSYTPYTPPVGTTYNVVVQQKLKHQHDIMEEMADRLRRDSQRRQSETEYAYKQRVRTLKDESRRQQQEFDRQKSQLEAQEREARRQSDLNRSNQIAADRALAEKLQHEENELYRKEQAQKKLEQDRQKQIASDRVLAEKLQAEENELYRKEQAQKKLEQDRQKQIASDRVLAEKLQAEENELYRKEQAQKKLEQDRQKQIASDRVLAEKLQTEENIKIVE